MGHELKIQWSSEYTTLVVIGIFVLLSLIFFQLQKTPVAAPPPQFSAGERRPRPRDRDRLIQNPDNVWYS